MLCQDTESSADSCSECGSDSDSDSDGYVSDSADTDLCLSMEPESDNNYAVLGIDYPKIGRYVGFFDTYEEAFAFFSNVRTNPWMLKLLYVGKGVKNRDVKINCLRIVRTIRDANPVIVVRDYFSRLQKTQKYRLRLQYDDTTRSDICNCPKSWSADNCLFLFYCETFELDMRNWEEHHKAFVASPHLHKYVKDKI